MAPLPPNPAPDRYLLRWRGREEGPLSLPEIEHRLNSHQIGLLHEIQLDGKWISVREFLEWRAAQTTAEQSRQRETERRAKEELDRHVREREAQDRAAFLAEEKRKNDLLAAAVESQKKSTGAFSASSPVSSTHVLGIILLAVGLGMTIYFFAFFDQTVAAGTTRVNNLGLMQDRQVGITASIGLTILGTLMALLGGKSKKA